MAVKMVLSFGAKSPRWAFCTAHILDCLKKNKRKSTGDWGLWSTTNGRGCTCFSRWQQTPMLQQTNSQVNFTQHDSEIDSAHPGAEQKTVLPTSNSSFMTHCPESAKAWIYTCAFPEDMSKCRMWKKYIYWFSFESLFTWTRTDKNSKSYNNSERLESVPILSRLKIWLEAFF